MRQQTLLLFFAIVFIASCKPKDTPAPQAPSSQNDSTSTDSTSTDTTSGGFNENVLPRHEYDGTITKTIKSHDGNILALGSNSTGPAIWKISIADGSIMWVKDITDSNYVFTGITETDNNDIVVSGYRPHDSLIVKVYNGTVDVVHWRIAYIKPTMSYYEGPSQIISLSNGNLLLYNVTKSPNHFHLHKMVLDENGHVIANSLSYSNGSMDMCSDIIRTSNDQIVAAFTGGPTMFSAKFMSADGSEIATHQIPKGATVGQCSAVKEAPNGDVLFCGIEFPLSGPGGFQGFVARYSSGLGYLDQYLYNDTTRLKNIIPTNDGFIAIGEYYSNKTFAMRSDNSGTSLWKKIYPPGLGGDYPINIFESGSYYIVVGNCTDRFFVMGMDGDGKVHP